MTKKLYNLMDWAEIEAVTYAEEDHPKAVLGAHPVRGGQTLVTAYRPDAAEVSVKVKGTKAAVDMELADEDGYFAALVKNKEPFEYELIVKDKEGNTKTVTDPYSFPDSITKRDIQKYVSGIHYRAYELLGAQVMKINGIEGVRFAVWAPNAIRVSVVGDFNNWDGRMYQMERLFDSGIFELFVPGLSEGEKYKFELKLHSGLTFMRRDPYAFLSEDKEDGAGIVYNTAKISVSDDAWLEQRGRYQRDDAAICIFDCRNVEPDKKSAKNIIEKAKKYGFTHVLISSPNDSLYIPVKKPEELASFVEQLHRAQLAVIFSWTPASFDSVSSGLTAYDGTCIYEDPDGNRSYVPGEDRKYFNLGRGEVRNYVVANAVFLLDLFHFDALMVKDVAKMLYLDYGKSGSGWTPNMYGGNENLDAIDFLRQMTSAVHKLSSDVLVISDDDTSYAGITDSVSDEGLGFDYKLDRGWSRDVTGYFRQEPLARSNHYNEICFPMIYQYNERFILPLSDIADIWNDMPGDSDEKFSNLKCLIAYFFMHPGKKMISMDNLDEKSREQKYVAELLADAMSFYSRNEVLHSKDLEQEGFEWINNISARENILVFARRGAKRDDLFVIVANFLNIPRKKYKIGVPKAGKYTEVFNSDSEKYDGFGFVNKDAVLSEKDECDGREDSVRIRVAPYGITVLRYNAVREQKVGRK
ncbi:MAG: alpha amylase C-terminal domain-containing protein [Lachnospiraceae bacterium]|nr:alpha amylase C-terminal domain-containing protein [Lachnospiraceae bacterium]